MRNKLEHYISLGSQLPIRTPDRNGNPEMTAKDIRVVTDADRLGWFAGWSDAALAALVADVRKHESKCTSGFVTMDFPAMTDRAIMDEVNHAVNPLFASDFRRAAYPGQTGRQAVDVETVKAGDKVFMTGDPTPRTVLHIHVSKLFVSFTVVSHDDAMPHLIHRHRGALINKEIN